MLSYESLPETLPAPVDDGACDHLPGLTMPALTLIATKGPPVDLARLSAKRTVLFAYPMTGRPGVALPEGWNDIPGARGCTPQNCAFRDAHQAFAALGADIVGLSTQSPAYQHEMAARLDLPYPVLSDEHFALTDALGLPTFTVDGTRLVRRLTLVIAEGRIIHVFYPVFPPDRATDRVLDWLRAHPAA
jgi:peroxiredoxin